MDLEQYIRSCIKELRKSMPRLTKEWDRLYAAIVLRWN